RLPHRSHPLPGGPGRRRLAAQQPQVPGRELRQEPAARRRRLRDGEGEGLHSRRARARLGPRSERSHRAHPGTPAHRTAGRERRGARSAAQLRRPRTIRRHRPDRGRRRHPLPGATDGHLEPLSRRPERKDDMTLTSSTLESAVTAAVSDLLFAIDDLDWEGVRNALADEVTIDYTSLWGGEPEHLAAS